MIEPQRIGRFLGVDQFGHVKPDVAIEHVGAVWTPLVAYVRDTLMNRPGVQSVYLRGSIPRGLAIEGISDADFLYVSENNFDRADIELAQSVEARFDFVKGLELFRLDRSAFDKIRPPQRRPYYHMLLKTQCLLLAGEDIATDIAPFAIGIDMVSHVFALAAEFARLPKLVKQARNRGVEQAMHQWFSRRIVRSGFEITMDRSDRFTRDLYLCHEQFAEFNPNRATQMFRVLINSLNRGESPLRYRELVSFLAGEGGRLRSIFETRPLE